MQGYQAPSTMAELREWATRDDNGMQNRAATTILLGVTHSNLKAQFPEIRLDLHMSILSVKEKLYTHTGTQPDNQQLTLRDSAGGNKVVLSGDDTKLGYFSPEEGDFIHITDLDPNSASAQGWLEDTSLVQKYEMTEEDYEKREGTVRDFKRQQQLLKKIQKEQSGEVDDPEMFKAEAEAIQEGNRCECFPGGRRATVRYVGKAEKLGLGWWIGVEYDDPVGKNDGSVKGVKFFECTPGFGGMIRPDKVTVGDFPSLDDELALSDDD